VTDIADASKVSDPLGLITIVVSDIPNQVLQRKKALSYVKTPLVLQIDDDVELDPSAIFEMLHSLGSDKKRVVGGMILDVESKKLQSQRYADAFLGSKLLRFYLVFLNSFSRFSEMSLLRSGRVVPVLYQNDDVIHGVDWLNSFLCYYVDASEEVIIPAFNEKAYYEDVFFTAGLRVAGYELVLNKKAIGYHPKTFRVRSASLMSLLRSQYLLVKNFGLSVPLFLFDALLILAYYVYHDVIKLIKENRC